MVAVERSHAAHATDRTTATSSSTSAGRTLREGDRGDDVRTLQQKLNARGAHLDVDGAFGPLTAAAVRGFQRSQGLDVDGVVGPQTAAKLGAARATDGGDRLLKAGDEGRDVLGAERKLHKLGYDTGRVDGKFDQQTVKAVRAFQADEGARDRTGRLGAAGQATLSRAASSWDHAPERTRVTKNLDGHRRLNALTTTQVDSARTDGKVGLGEGDVGSDATRAVRNVQAHLQGAGYAVGKNDGVFDARTTAAVKTFQHKSALPVTGRVDGATWQALQKSQLLASSSTSPAQQVGERSAAVRHTEQQLEKLGYDTGRVDGKFDGATLRAVHRFQREHQLQRTDGVGGATVRALDKAVKNGGIVRPIAARLTSVSEFGYVDAEGAPGNNGVRHHAGKDWFAPGGSTVRSPVEGTIVEARASRGNTGQIFGGTVKVQGKDGKVWVFRHVDPKNVRVGQHVGAGDHIAAVTAWRDGPSHAHIELWKTYGGGYDFENMLDPMTYLKRFL